MTDPTGGDTDPAPIDLLAEVLIYAPLGLALEARRLFPGLVDRGRGQVKLARATGRRAVHRYQHWVEDQVDDARSEAGAALRGLGLAAADDSDEGGPGPEPALGIPSNGAATAPRATPDPVPAVPDEVKGPAVDVSTLAIPDYDSLSASQVVPRLAGLEADELEAVRGYEAGHRGRKTILNKIAQLQAG